MTMSEIIGQVWAGLLLFSVCGGLVSLGYILQEMQFRRAGEAKDGGRLSFYFPGIGVFFEKYELIKWYWCLVFVLSAVIFTAEALRESGVWSLPS